MRFFSRRDQDWPNCVMISGPMRSGTTVLQRVLTTASGSNGVVPEFGGALAAYVRGRNKLHGEQLVAEAIRSEFVTFWQKNGRPELLIAKDPLITEHIRRFVDLTPKVRHVISIRDPRDVIQSVLTIQSKMLATADYPVTVITKHNEIGIVNYIMKIYEAIQRIESRPNVMLSRYEDLVVRDEGLRQRLSDFIGREVSYSPENSDLHPNDRYFSTAISGRDISPSRVGTGKHLPPLAERELGRYPGVIAQFGYEAPSAAAAQ